MRDIQDKSDGVGFLSAVPFNVNLINELQAVPESAGFTLDPEVGPDSDTAMLKKSLALYGVGSLYYADSGSANAYVLTRASSLQPLPSYIDGATVIFKAANSNTGPSLINVDSIGSKDLTSFDGNALIGGEILADEYVIARYNYTTDDFELVFSTGAFVRRDKADTVSLGLILGHTASLSAFDSGGVAYNVASLNGDVFTFGNAAYPVSILSDGTLTHNGATVWTSANGGTGSGLAADTVDGYHVDTSYIPNSGLTKVGDWGASRYSLDFTGLSVDDAHFVINVNGSNITGAPDTGPWFISALGDGTYTAQIAYSQTDDKDIRVRGHNGAAWSSWSSPITFDDHTHLEADITDLDKYTQAQIDAALLLKADTSLIGAISGICPLDSSGLVDSIYLPSYVDDVVESADYASLPTTGETGKIYITLDNGNIYRWSGSTYIEINTSVATADEALKLTTARTITIAGDAVGSNTFDGSANVTITVNVTDSEALGGVAAASWLRADVADTVSGALTFATYPILNNQIYLRGKNISGSDINLIGMNSNDRIVIGSATNDLLAISTGVFTHNGATVWTSANDGVSSGLDAGLLGGVLPSGYAKIAADNTFTANQYLSGLSPLFQITDTYDGSYTKISRWNGGSYFQFSGASGAGNSDIYITGADGAPAGTLYIYTGGANQAFYHTGNDSNLAKLNAANYFTSNYGLNSKHQSFDVLTVSPGTIITDMLINTAIPAAANYSPVIKIKGKHGAGIIDIAVYTQYSSGYSGYSYAISNCNSNVVASVAQNASGNLCIHLYLASSFYYPVFTVSLESGLNMLSMTSAHIAGWTYQNAVCPATDQYQLPINSGFRTDGQITSTVATGTAPFSVASTTMVTNLNADSVDGIQGSAILQTNSINGSFTTTDGKTITVVNGQITAIV